MTTENLTDEERALREWLITESDNRGNAVVEVAGEPDAAPFTFTVGAWRRFGVPEAIAVGLPPGVGARLVDTFVERAARGKRFIPGVRYHDFFDGVPITLERVAKGHYFPYFGSAFLLYPDGDFPAVQLIVPTPGLVWPWQPHAPAGFAAWQPVLTVSGRPESWTPGVNGP